MKRASKDTVDRDAVSWIEEIVDTSAHFAAVSRERLLAEKSSQPHLRVAVRKSSPCQADPDVGVGSDCTPKAVLGIQVDGSDRESEGLVGVEIVRLVKIVEGIAPDRSPSLQRLVVTYLKKVSLLGINLSLQGKRLAKQQ